MSSKPSKPVPSDDDARRELRKVLDSRTLQSPRQKKLLEYLCNKALLGETEQVKAATVAIEVFGRLPDFDESKDAIVRVEAHRLRKKLAKYYETEGAADAIEIRLPVGRYVPEFVSRVCENGAASEEPLDPVPDPSARGESPDPAGVSDSVARTGLPVRLTGGVGIAAAGIIVAGLVFMGMRSHAGRVVAAGGVREAPIAAAPSGPEIRILAGLEKGTYVDRFGSSWGADHYFHGGKAEAGAKNLFPKPADAGLFATMRTGEFSYDIPAPLGVYELYLYWAEPVFRGEGHEGGENERRFHVKLNGEPLLTAFDVVADAGISSVDVRAFKDVRPDADGFVHLRFSADYGTPFLNALALIPSSATRARPIRIRAHELSFTDHEGNAWSADNYFLGGRLATHKYVVDRTPDPELYAGERFGNFTYVIPAPPGSYAVTLYFAETYFRPDSAGDDHGVNGSRVFDVYCNGTTLLHDFDVLRAGGFSHAVTRTFHRIRPNGQGKIVINFSPNRNYATVNAIEIVDES